MSATASDTAISSPEGPSSPKSPSKATESKEPVAKKARVEEETSYKTFDEWFKKEGSHVVYDNIVKRFNYNFGVKGFAKLLNEFAKLHNNKGSKITCWEEFDEEASKNSDAEKDMYRNIMNDMVIELRDFYAYTEKLRERNSELEELLRKVAD